MKNIKTLKEIDAEIDAENETELGIITGGRTDSEKSQIEFDKNQKGKPPQEY
jgi:hypothetical protein